jgi:hypothetical protein
MLSVEQCRKIEPELAGLSDEEVLAIRDACIAFVQLAFDAKTSVIAGSKFPPGLSTKS